MKKYVAESIGTAVLVIFGCGTAVAINNPAVTGAAPLAVKVLTIAFAFGLSIVAMAYSIGNVSGCHINPAVSVGMFVAHRMDGKECLRYILSQCIGAIIGAAVLCVLFGSNKSLGQNGYGSASALGTSAGVAFLVEMILTFVFVLTILGVTSTDFKGAGLVIGLTLTLIHILGIPFTGTSVNPARSLGPALLAGGVALQQLWLFIVAPLAGAVLAGLAYPWLAGKTSK